MNGIKPAKTLVGRTVGAGWTVISEVPKTCTATGGQWSTAYIVERADERAFLKAMDLSAALQEPDQLAALRHFADMIEFEGAVLQICRDRGLSRVVRLIEQGILDDTGDRAASGLVTAASRVYFFIFELAEGDTRHRFARPPDTKCSLKLQVLHQVATGLLQLHGASIAHQDVKPSNVVHFGSDEHKLADLGRASIIGRAGPTDHYPFPGDNTYMPPEYAYGYTPAEAIDRRFGTDAYLLGSMIAFLFTLQGASTLLRQRVPPHVLPRIWSADPMTAWAGSFQDALPYLITVHGEVAVYLKSQIDGVCADPLTQAYFELAHPDPVSRGHPRARSQVGRPLGLDRYVTLFDRLAKQAKLNERSAVHRIVL